MLNNIKAFSKQFFGAKYEGVRKSLLAAVVLFIAIYAAEIQIVIAPFIFYLTSACFTAGVMCQVITGRRHMEAMQGMFMLPFDNRSFLFSYVVVLGVHTLITKTLLVWALFFAAAPWHPWEISIAVVCGVMACMVSAAGYRMCRKGHAVLPILWTAGILAVILLVRQGVAVLAASIVSLLAAVLYLAFADAYDFYRADVSKRAVQHTSHRGSVFVYLVRYLLANKSYLINTVGLCAIACFLPLLFGEFHGLNLFPIGLAILCLNTPICTLLSCDADLEQAIRVLPGQTERFCRKYCLFIFIVNGVVASIYLCSWKMIHEGIGFAHVGMVLLFALQSAIFSVILEWKHPIRGWKTESDLWHHPRKYLVPLVMLLMASIVGTYTPVLWIWGGALVMECGVLLYTTRME